jgi:hypothetical protein
MNKTNKIWIWIVVLLVVLNLTTIGTILYHNYRENSNGVAVSLSEEGQNRISGKYFRQTLGFNDDQMEAFRQANREFQPAAARLIFSIDSLKREMFKELNENHPDTAMLNYLSDQLGKHHAELKRITNNFYLKMKSVCDSSQCIVLQRTFLPLYYDETIQTRRGYGYGRGDSIGTNQGFRHRYGRNTQP